MDNLAFVRALLYVVENGCKWRTLPAEFGPWNSVYKKVNRWAKSGVLERLFLAMQAERLLTVKVEILALDSTSVKLHPDAHGALKKATRRPSASCGTDGTPSFMWSPRLTRLSSGCTFRAALAEANGCAAVVPPKSSRKEPWDYDRELYRRRHVVERFFRRIKGFRRVCTRYDKTDAMFLAFVQFAVVMIWLR